MSVRLLCSICGEEDHRLAIIIEEPEDIDKWLPYVCIDCIESGKSKNKDNLR